MQDAGQHAGRENADTELWMAVGGTGVDAHRYVEAAFDDEVIEIRVGLSLHVSTLGVIPDSHAGPFWRTFWEGVSPERKKAFSLVLEDAMRAALNDCDMIDWMERADNLLEKRFEECGGRAIEVPRLPVPDEDLDSDLDECRLVTAGSRN